MRRLLLVVSTCWLVGCTELEQLSLGAHDLSAGEGGARDDGGGEATPDAQSELSDAQAGDAGAADAGEDAGDSPHHHDWPDGGQDFPPPPPECFWNPYKCLPPPP